MPVVPLLPAPFGEHMVVVPEPKAESAEFSREWDTDGDFEPVFGGLKNDIGKLRMRNGTCRGRFETSGLSTVSKRACRFVSEFSSMRTTRFSATVAATAPADAVTSLLLFVFALLLTVFVAALLLLFELFKFPLLSAIAMVKSMFGGWEVVVRNGIRMARIHAHKTRNTHTKKLFLRRNLQRESTDLQMPLLRKLSNSDELNETNGTK